MADLGSMFAGIDSAVIAAVLEANGEGSSVRIPRPFLLAIHAAEPQSCVRDVWNNQLLLFLRGDPPC
jgi:hypothetical protein